MNHRPSIAKICLFVDCSLYIARTRVCLPFCVNNWLQYWRVPTFLCERLVAVVAAVRLLARMLLLMDLQRVLLVKGLVADVTLKRPLAYNATDLHVPSEVNLNVP